MVWPFTRQPSKESLQAYKKVRVQGMGFTIRRVSPLSDFDPGSMPMVFTDTTRRQSLDVSSPGVMKRAIEDMKMVIQAGVVDPPLSGPGKTGLSVDDVFRDLDMGRQLYVLILEHSLFKVRSWQKPIFFLGKQLVRFILWLRPTVFDRVISPSRVSA